MFSKISSSVSRLIAVGAAVFLGLGPVAAQSVTAPSGGTTYTVPYYEQPGSPVVQIIRQPPPAAAPAAPTYGAAQPAGQKEPAYYTENYTGPTEEEGAESKVAQIRVRLPASAELWINDHKTKQTGAVREFVTPDLDPERVYSFQLRARWLEEGITVEKRLKVKAFAGNRVTVNFVRPPAPARPQPVVRGDATAPSYPIQQDALRWIPAYP